MKCENTCQSFKVLLDKKRDGDFKLLACFIHMGCFIRLQAPLIILNSVITDMLNINFWNY